MQKITLDLNSKGDDQNSGKSYGKSYDILVGDDLLGQAGELIRPVLKRNKTVIITDRNVAPHHLPRLEQSLKAADIAFDSLVLPAGESTKSFDQLENLLDQLLRLKIERGDHIIAFGGGVIGDLVGFAASIYQRGIGFIQIPTSLLAQVDSSVGGKTGINMPLGKNLVGSFHQPSLVITDVNILDSLPLRHLKAGYAEIVKYGLINDRAFFDWLEDNAARIINGDKPSQIEAIVKSCRAKAAIVSYDEKEQGSRALLNLGHTFGHALEAQCGYGDSLIHGEAVAIGMVMAFDLSVRMGRCPKEDAARLRNHLDGLGLPTGLRDPDHAVSNIAMSAAELYQHSLLDKKSAHGRVTYVLAAKIGAAFLEKDIRPEDVKAVYQNALENKS